MVRIKEMKKPISEEVIVEKPKDKYDLKIREIEEKIQR